MVDGAVQSSVLYSIRWALMRGSNDAEDLLMYLNQPVPLAYDPFSPSSPAPPSLAS